jgi:hypothetical protein
MAGEILQMKEGIAYREEQLSHLDAVLRELVVLSRTVAVIKAENQVIEEIQYLARGGSNESR